MLTAAFIQGVLIAESRDTHLNHLRQSGAGEQWEVFNPYCSSCWNPGKNTAHHNKIRFELKPHGNSFVNSFFRCKRIPLKLGTEYISHIAMLCAKLYNFAQSIAMWLMYSEKSSSTKVAVLCKRDFNYRGISDGLPILTRIPCYMTQFHTTAGYRPNVTKGIITFVLSGQKCAVCSWQTVKTSIPEQYDLVPLNLAYGLL